MGSETLSPGPALACMVAGPPDLVRGVYSVWSWESARPDQVRPRHFPQEGLS